jgi:hypothetical protein
MFYKGAQRPFHALEVIRLVSVSFRLEAFRKMMALCPNLLTLDLRLCRCNGNGLVFDRLPPNLRSLTIACCDRITSLDLVRVPTLRSFRYSGCPSNLPFSIPRDAVLSDLYIQLYSYDSALMKEWNIDKLRKSLPEDLSSLSVLTICHKALTVLSWYSIFVYYFWSSCHLGVTFSCLISVNMKQKNLGFFNLTMPFILGCICLASRWSQCPVAQFQLTQFERATPTHVRNESCQPIQPVSVPQDLPVS